MAAGAGKDKGVLGGDFIQIVAVEHPVLVGEVIMVPPAAGDDRTRGGVVFCKKIPAALEHSSMEEAPIKLMERRFKPTLYICMWESMKPGTTVWPWASIISAPGSGR